MLSAGDSGRVGLGEIRRASTSLVHCGGSRRAGGIQQRSGYGAGVVVHPAGADSVVREESCCYQELVPLPAFDGNHVVLGAWTVEGEAAGLGIRESAGLVTDEYARFLPHIIRSGR